ncbi:MAG: hypothetical protein K8U03_20490 [Planctomycetia bacterium]|nr:hypothetical protein [Planctomycetia bacterium]
MNFQESLLFYFVIGVAVAVAFGLAERRTFRPATIAALIGAVLFWPIYLPLILSASNKDAAAPSPTVIPRDEFSHAIEQIERELEAALAGLDGWAEQAMNRNSGRLGELRAALVAQAERIREMDALLAEDRAAVAEVVTVDAEPEAADERRRKSRQARQENMHRLAEIRRRTRSEMLDTFAWIRELVSMIHLAKFTGAPASRAEELVAQIATAVESISIVATTPS